MATTPSSSVVAFFSSEAQATSAISALKSAGFQANQIGAATSAGASDVTSPASAPASSTGSVAGGVTGAATTAAHSTGAAAEGVWGKVKSFFEGEEGGVEQYADESANDRSSHEITRGSSRYEAGDVSHSLTGMSVPDEHSRYFEHRFGAADSGVLVTVTAPGREQEAQTILEQNGGDLGTGAADYDYSAAPAVTAATGTQHIQLLGEVLRVHKDRISRGEVRIRKEIITEQQTVQVPVTREELVIERIPVTGQVVQGTIGENSEIRIPLSEEQASIDKQTVVREEVSVGKREIENVQEVGGAVRHEELRVEDETVGGTTAGTTGSSFGDTTRKL